ncbi:phage terminase large subunit-like protein [Paraburkholderia sp. BL23I1N1]|uniref:terminase large subunit domain-containing protein n=1 Tax=Paraburkholderia sp. BL23I1N1 TaxID=1938802 RepID=UPI000FF28418|nr:terminase family protein [Paraburkholderia sp. BL23I1N1]RKE36651.1 phage terminase large subunit-like protein [Paraburkholderia sp. BL23I1N1]
MTSSSPSTAQPSESIRLAKAELLAALLEKAERRAKNRLAFYTPYEWQAKFFAAGAENRQRLLMAANRVGKTESAAFEMAMHLTGRYPDWWEGYRFKRPIRAWALGVSGEQIRDVIQRKLLGDFDGDRPNGKGTIPAECIGDFIRSPQTKNLIKDVQIKHVSGGWSSLSLKAYEQGQHVLMGDSIDYIWIDEEPRDQDIYPQCLTRTLTGDDNRGGLVTLTFTPENGMTPLVSQFMEDIKEGQFLLNVTWADAPHLTEQAKAQILAAYPAYQREMRSKGVPAVGAGLIFTVPDEQITIQPFQIPPHWFVLNGLDFGWDHPQAHVQLAHDRDADAIYVTHAWRASQKDASQARIATQGWAKDVPYAWPHDGLQHEKGGGEVLKKQYADAGFKMLGVHATWPSGGYSVEAGLWEMQNRMENGTWKVFANLTDWFEEKRLYHRDKNGQIVKERDDLLSASRYAYMMRRLAVINKAAEPKGSIAIPRTASHWNNLR